MNGEYYINMPQKVAEAHISLGAKVLYGQINRLSRKEGYCYASNKYLGGLLNVSERTVSRMIGELKQSNFIVSKETIEDGLTKRYLYII